MGAISQILDPIQIPKMLKIKQQFDTSKIDDISKEVSEKLHRPAIAATIKPGMSVAITAGSRGISGYVEIIKTVVAFVKEQGAKPFIIPAMGSHGGATAEGQIGILKANGITEESVGAPIKSSMEVVSLGNLEDGTPVCIDKNAAEADGIILVNRIKPHTAFRGEFESGLHKMMAIGLGKQKGADTLHDRGTQNLGKNVKLFGGFILNHAKILFGVGTVENAFDKACIVEALLPAEIKTEEPKLLLKAKALMPKLFFENLDILLVDQTGKDISGSGMDPNITFTFPADSGIPCDGKATRIVVFDLTEGTHGNPSGLTRADITTKRAVDKIDREQGYPNLLTIGTNCSTPMYFDNQKQAIQAAIKILPADRREKPRMARIKDTLHVSEFEISEGLLEEAQKNPNVEILSDLYEFDFNSEGNLF